MTDDDRNIDQFPKGFIDELSKHLHIPLGAARQGLDFVLQCLNERVAGQVAAILTPNGDSDLGFMASTDNKLTATDFPKVPLSGSIAGLVFLTGQTMAMDDASQSPQFHAEVDARSGYVTKEYLAVPIVHHGDALGVMTVVNRSAAAASPRFTEQDLSAAQRYADLLGVLMVHSDDLKRVGAEADAALGRLVQSADAQDTRHIPDDRSGDARHDDLRARITGQLDGLGEEDLELAFDLIERLAGSP